MNVFKAFLSTELTAGGSETTISLDRITTLTGETITTSQFATLGRGILTINPNGDGNVSYPEWDSFTAVSGTTVTGVVRGLSSLDNSVITANKRFHPVGTPVVLSFGVHNLLDIIEYVDDEVAAISLGTAAVVLATAGETVAAGNLVYLKNDGKWWLSDADTSTTIDNVQLGIAQGAGTANNSITGGVMVRGLDTHQSGLVAGTTYYASNTAGGVSSTAGTNNKIVGVGRSSTSLYFDTNFFSLPDIGIQNMTYGESITAGQAVYLKASDQKVYKTDSDASATTFGFIGFAYESGSTNEVHRVQIMGIVTGLSGLTAGTTYYLGATIGAIQSTVGTFGFQVGVALSTTTLLINPKTSGAIPYIFVYEVGASPATWTKKDGLKYIRVRVVGGGGGGGGNTTAGDGAGGGGGGGYSEKIIAASALGTTETVTIGAGGTPGAAASSASGGLGGTSSFGTHAQATGGSGGGSSGAGGGMFGGDGGIGSLGTINVKGSGGDSGTANNTDTGGTGKGGSSVLGGGGKGPGEDEQGGQDGGVYGGGGSGAVSNGGDAPGGSGGAGVVIVEEYY